MVSLSKDQRISLQKKDGQYFNTVTVGLGWDPVKPKKEAPSFFNLFGLLSRTPNIDCDASVILCVNDKLRGDDDVVSFLNLTHRTGLVKHMGDNLTGDGEGDDEQIFVDLKRLPIEYNRLIFVVNIFIASSRNQHFGMIENCFIRICDEKGVEFCRYNLSEKYAGCRSMILGEMLRTGSGWEFKATGQGLEEDDLNAICDMFK